MLLRLLIVAMCLAASAARAADWPEFRGPTGQGLAGETPLPTEWGPDKNVVWKQALPGAGWSSPIVFGDQIFLTAAVGSGGKLSLRTLCLEAKTGKIAWNVELFTAAAPKIHNKNSHASPTPITDGKRLFVHFGTLGTACLDLAGKVIWKNSEIKYNMVHGSGCSPILVDDALVFTCDGGDRQFVMALNTATGKPLWTADRGPLQIGKRFAFCTPLLIEVGGKKQIISPAAGFVGAYDPKNGKEIWRVRYGTGYSIIPRPVFGHGLIFLSTSYDSPKLLAIKPDGTGDVTATHIAWELSKGAPHSPSPLLLGDELYIVSDNGIASCLDAVSGKPHWQQRIGGNYSASPIAADGKIYFQSEEGVGTVIKAGKSFEQVAKNTLDERSLASFAAVDGALFIRTDKHLYRIQAK